MICGQANNNFKCSSVLAILLTTTEYETDNWKCQQNCIGEKRLINIDITRTLRTSVKLVKNAQIHALIVLKATFHVNLLSWLPARYNNGCLASFYGRDGVLLTQPTTPKLWRIKLTFPSTNFDYLQSVRYLWCPQIWKIKKQTDIPQCEKKDRKYLDANLVWNTSRPYTGGDKMF